jgi:hypothetical protein
MLREHNAPLAEDPLVAGTFGNTSTRYRVRLRHDLFEAVEDDVKQDMQCMLVSAIRREEFRVFDPHEVVSDEDAREIRKRARRHGRTKHVQI